MTKTQDCKRKADRIVACLTRCRFVGANEAAAKAVRRAQHLNGVARRRDQ